MLVPVQIIDEVQEGEEITVHWERMLCNCCFKDIVGFLLDLLTLHSTHIHFNS